MLTLPATNDAVLADVIEPALSVRGIIQRSGQARQRQPRPHHSRTCKEVAAMANANSTRPVARSSNGTPLYECVCPDCGVVRIQDSRKLGKPCHPCAMKRRATHGLTNHWLYRKWAGVKARCTIPSAAHFAYYGGRGIRMCDEWLDNPQAFIEWAESHGAARGLEIDRIDSDGDYSPDNCRFISHVKNSRNRRNRGVTDEEVKAIKAALAKGVTYRQIARDTGVHHMIVWHIAHGNTWKD